MNQLCKVCGEPAAGFHFGAFTCEGCKSFFGRTYNNLSQVHECKNGGQCVINKQNRTSCKACRLRKCLMVGMSKSGSRYGRRSNWFKIHCLLQEQAAQMNKGMEGGGGSFHGAMAGSLSLSPASMPALSPVKSEDDAKLESPILSSPESCPSETSVDVEPRRTSSPKEMNVGDSGRVEIYNDVGRADRESGRRDLLNAARLSLYGLHPGLSLLHASHLYSRLYPPVLYSGMSPALLAPPSAALTRPHPPPSPPKDTSSSPRMCSPASFSPQSFSPRHSSPRPMSPPSRSTNDYRPSLPPPLALPLGFPLNRKRVADSPIEEMWEATPAPEQDAPIDLSVKRPRMLPPSPSTHTPVSPPVSPVHTSIPTSTTPVDLTTKA